MFKKASQMKTTSFEEAVNQNPAFEHPMPDVAAMAVL